MSCSDSDQYTSPSNQTAISHPYENSSVTSTTANYYIQTNYYKSENVSVLNGEGEFTSSTLNIKTHSSSVNTTLSEEYREVGASNINPSSAEVGDDGNTSKLLVVMVTFALLFGIVTCFYIIFTKVRYCEKIQNRRQSTHVAKMTTDNHVVGISMATAKSAEEHGFQDIISWMFPRQHYSTVPANEKATAAHPMGTRSQTQPLPARPPHESRHAHARSELLSDSRDLVHQEGTHTGGNLLAFEMGRSDKGKGQTTQAIDSENVYSTVD